MVRVPKKIQYRTAIQAFLGIFEIGSNHRCPVKRLLTSLASVVVLVLLTLIVSCDNDGEKGAIPTVTTLEPVMSGAQVQFKATLTAVKTPISSVGFEFTTQSGSDRIVVGGNSTYLTFEGYVSPYYFQVGGSYTVRAYFYLGSEIHYGNTITFTYQPSQVWDILPLAGPAGTLVTITGANFPEGTTTVSFNGVNASIVSASKTQLVVKVPNSQERGYQSGVVHSNGFDIHYFSFYFSLASISGINPSTGTFSDIITITGKGFSNSFWGNAVYFDGHQAQVIEGNSTTIKVMVPHSLASASSKITVYADGDLAESAEPFILKAPTFDFSPKSGTFGTLVTLSGDNFNPISYYNQVFFGDVPAQVLEASKTSITIVVPNEFNSPTGRSAIRLAHGPGDVVSPDEFELNAHTISSISPDIGTRGNTITITGTNFNLERSYNTITIGSFSFQPSQSTSTSLTFTLPAEVSGGEFEVKVTTGGREISSAFLFTIKDPWSRKANLGGGARYGGFGFAIGNLGYIGGGFNNSGFLKNDFYAYDPQTNTWTRKADIPVNGEGVASFSTDTHGYVLYQKELWQYDPQTNKWSSKAEYPGNAIRNLSAIVSGDKAYVGGGVNFSGTLQTEQFSYNLATDEWISSGSSPYGNHSGLNAGDKSYLLVYGSWNSTAIKIFNTQTRGWDDVSLSADFYNQFYYRQNAAVISGKTVGYFGTGAGSWSGTYADFFSIDPSTHETKRLSDIPYSRQRAMGFEINGKAYLGGGIQDYNASSARSDFYQYDPEKEL
jgi:hypothetical protein